MDVNGVTNSYATQSTAATTSTKATKQPTTASSTANDTAVVYQSSGQTAKTYTPNTALVNQMKADTEQRTSQLRSLVENLISKQGKTFAMGDDSDMWKLLRTGELTVDEAAKKQAQEDISENGYWGVNQTSSRILDFAKALCGGDPDKIDAMQSAFEKGFKQATKAWGDTLPSISQDTYKAVQDGFDKWREEAKASTQTNG